ncbi:Glycosyltransferase [Candidatus Paraburkholderia calva]|nr:Glycosyltransferase [Candidatus Paraburkholderia calva]
MWDYSRGLAERGHEIVIYILSYGPGMIREVAPGISVRFVHIDCWMRLVDPVLWRLSRGTPSSPLRTRVATRAWGGALQRCLEEDRIDVLYHQEIWTPHFDAIVECARISVVGAVFNESMTPAKRRALPRAAKLVCQTSSSLKLAKEFGGDAVTLTNAVDCDLFAPGSAPRQRTILAVGRLVESQKRFIDLLRAIVQLPEYTLALVGTGPDDVMLRRLAAELGVADRVDFAGFVSDRTRLRSLYQECGVFVCSSSWEAVALVVLEAMSCAVLVVVTCIPSFEELVVDNVSGALVDVGAVDDLARAIEYASANGERLGHGAREITVSRYSAAHMFDSLADLLGAIPEVHA